MADILHFKTNNDINVRKRKMEIDNRKCIHEGCVKHAAYNYENEKKRLYCGAHKLELMINVLTKRCQAESCQKIPSYNFPPSKTAIRCEEHKSEGMEDVKHKSCSFKGCTKRPSSNYVNIKTPIYCAKHRLDNMVNVVTGKCQSEGCNTIAVYNVEGSKAGMFCVAHKELNMVDVHSRLCSTPMCGLRVKDKYDGLCLRCYMFTYPNKEVTRNYKTKEMAVVEYIKTKFSGYDWVCDKKVKEGCSSRRPDMLLDLGYQVIVVEVDENQHDQTNSSYLCSCENKRTMQLSQDVGHRPIVFIRFNPDSYVDKSEANNTKIPSCWGTNKKGICVITDMLTWDNRLTTLSNHVDYWIREENVTDKLVETVELYYDR